MDTGDGRNFAITKCRLCPHWAMGRVKEEGINLPVSSKTSIHTKTSKMQDNHNAYSLIKKYSLVFTNKSA